MKRILFPVDGSKCSVRAAQHLAAQRGTAKSSKGGGKADELHLLNVQAPLPGDVSMFVAAEQIRGFHHDESVKALAPVRRVLDRARIPYTVHMAVGEPAATIVRFAGKLKCDEIVMGTHGRGALGRMLMGSVASRVLHEARMPVLLVK